MMNRIRALVREKKGAAAAEYSLLAAIILTLILVAVVTMEGPPTAKNTRVDRSTSGSALTALEILTP